MSRIRKPSNVIVETSMREYVAKVITGNSLIAATKKIKKDAEEIKLNNKLDGKGVVRKERISAAKRLRL